MYGDGLIKVYDGAIPDDLCDRMMEAHWEKERNNETQLGRARNGALRLGYRAHVKTKFHDGDPRLEEMRAEIVKWRDQYVKDVGLVLEDGLRLEEELFSIKRYPIGCGLFDEHADIAPPTCRREVSVLVYLNTVKEGGGTHFIYQNKMIQPVKGRIALFPSHWAFFHEGTKPVSEDKVLITAFHQLVRDKR